MKKKVQVEVDEDEHFLHVATSRLEEYREGIAKTIPLDHVRRRRGR